MTTCPPSESEAIRHLGETERFAAILARGWDEALGSLPEKFPQILSAEAIAENAAWAGLDPDVVQPLQNRSIVWWQDRFLRALCWYCIDQLNRPDSPQHFHDMPSLEAALGADRGLFYLLAALTMVPAAVARYRTQGLADEAIRHTLQQYRCFCNNHRVGNAGLPGINCTQLGWLRHYRDGVLHRLGRLEFKLDRAHGFGLLLRRRSDEVKILLAGNGQRFDRQGLVEYDNCPDEQHWIADLDETPDRISGYPINPAGLAVRQRTDYPLTTWEVLARAGDLVVDMHIPSGGGLTPAACRQSFELAAAFFTRRFPSANARLIFCQSWIFNPQLEERMPDSNLAALQREVYLFPVKSTGEDGLNFVFCRATGNRAELPRETTLQKTLLGILDAGQKLRSAGMIYAIEDLPHYGTQIYRRHWPRSVQNE